MPDSPVSQNECRPDPTIVRGKARRRLSDLDKPPHDWRPVEGGRRCERCGATVGAKLGQFGDSTCALCGEAFRHEHESGICDDCRSEHWRYHDALTKIASVSGPLIEADPATLGHGYEQIAKEALDG